MSFTDLLNTKSIKHSQVYHQIDEYWLAISLELINNLSLYWIKKCRIFKNVTMLIVYWLQFLRCDVVHVYHNKEKDNLHVIFLSSCINDKTPCPFNRRSFFPIKLPLKKRIILLTLLVIFIHLSQSVFFSFFACYSLADVLLIQKRKRWFLHRIHIIAITGRSICLSVTFFSYSLDVIIIPKINKHDCNIVIFSVVRK